MATAQGKVLASKWLHVLGAGQWQVPTIQLARRLGYQVYVTDMYTERPGYSLADAYDVIDIRDKEKTLAAALERGIHGIVCDTTDVGVTTAAYVADHLGLPSIGWETALNFTQKDRMRRLTMAAGLPGPRYRLVRSPSEALQAAEEIGYPVIVKPPDNQSSRGVSCAGSPDQLSRAFDHALQQTRRGEILVEEFIQGTEITVESFCWKGRVFPIGISDKEHFAENPQVASQLVYPADLAPGMLQRAKDVNQEVIRVLGLETGATHAEYIVNERGVFLVEIAARGGGSRIYSDIVPFLAGISIPEIVIRWSLREEVDFAGLQPAERAAILAFFSAPAGRVRSVQGITEVQAIPGVHEVLIEVKAGERFLGIQDDRSRPGFVIGFGTSRADVLSIASSARRQLHIDIDQAPDSSGGRT